jgi:glucose-1-phosphate thymidylyltransferase
MRIIVPMAGMGKRMRPHTLTVPKPLIKIAGKPIVQRLVEDIAKVANEKVEEVAFIIGRFGKEAEESLIKVAESLGAKGTIYYQDEALGTAHAIYCAEPSLQGNIVVAFADTLFKADFKMDTTKEGVIWVQKVDDPRHFGVVKIAPDNTITDFVEKPQEFVSDLAIIGIYYFKQAELLKKEIKYLLDNDIKEKGEYQLTNALENLKKQGIKFTPGQVTEWLDCGNKNATVYTNQRVLEFLKGQEQTIDASVRLENSVIIDPCYIGANVRLVNSVIGPHVSIGKDSVIESSVVSNSILQEKVHLKDTVLSNSMLGTSAQLSSKPKDLSVSDYSEIKL